MLQGSKHARLRLQNASAARPLKRLLFPLLRAHPVSTYLAASADHALTDTASSGSRSNDNPPHVPVLFREVLELLQPAMPGRQLQVYVDGTLGSGGHASMIMQAHKDLKALVGVDLDPTAHAIAQPKLRALAHPEMTLHFVQANYSEAARHLRHLPAPPSLGLPSGMSLHGHVDGMLMDLGVSSMQIDTAERGFSFLREGPLDMRMDPGARLSAEEAVNTWSEAELGRIIRDYGEEKMWRQVASRIVRAREHEVIRTTQQLTQAIGFTHVQTKGGGGAKKKKDKKSQIHPATRTFQALRIAVNDEINKLEQAIPAAIDALAPYGRLAVISFHSLEDRAVKHAFSRAVGKPTPEEQHLTYGPGKYEFLDQLEARATCKLVTRKPAVAGEEELQSNPRSRSAKLRVIERKGSES
mmetsp:Transcript_4359/g.11835  ORF Transcript_4359/g.11835 Transcript_4359/m.11835 type:complete len:412 (+) Transcript_4359:165-1400(+)